MSQNENGAPAPAENETEQTTATSELAAILEHESKLSAADLAEDPIILAAEDEKATTSWATIIPALVIIGAVLIFGLVAPDRFADTASATFTWVIDNLGWAFVLFSTAFVIFVICIAASRFGSIRLGAQDEQPEFSTASWISMMFAAGMGIGLMFYGASEPLSHYLNGVPNHQSREVGTAMATAMYHWTLHPWAMYAIVGLAIGYSTYRLGRKQLISSAFVPLIGQKGADGWPGKAIDALSIVATVFGTACSLGLGALQIRAGLQAAGLVEDPGTGLVITIVLVLTLAFLISAMSGVGRGIRIISNGNMILAAVLAIFVFIMGPTVTQLNFLPTSLGTYFSDFFEMSGRTASSADGTAGSWLSGWTIFYWAWWISWSPFVGMFIARISRGRTVREFILGVIFIPSALSTVWFAIFGGSAISLEQSGHTISADNAEEQLFNLLHAFPGGWFFGVVAVILLATFFITSADSASTVMGSISQDGRANATPWMSAIWGAATAAIGLLILVTGGNEALTNLQNVTIVAATPFLFVVIALMVAVVRDLQNDQIYRDIHEQEEFARKLAVERRLVREHAEVERVKAARRKLMRGARLPHHEGHQR